MIRRTCSEIAAATRRGPFRLPCVVLLVLSGSGDLQAQDRDRLDELLDRNTHWMSAVDDAYAGAGADWLLSEAEAAEFLVVGERHGTRETPKLMSWLLRELAPAGFEAYGVEIGPVSARMLGGMARSDEAMVRLTDFFVSTPFAVPFFWWQAELESLITAVEKGYEIWGLDQEFVGSGRIHLSRLRELAPDEQARALTDAWWDREMAALAEFQRTESSEGALFMAITEDELTELREAFAGVGEAEVILDEIAASAIPYQLFASGENYRSNHERIRLMKRHLNDYLKQPGGPEPTGGGKVILKFGEVHSGRGYSPLNQLDVGNHAAALASLRGGESLHLLVAAREYRALDGSVTDTSSSRPELAPLLQRVEGERWGIFDLRALRPLVHTPSGREGLEALADVIWAYDVLIVAPTFTQARDVGN